MGLLVEMPWFSVTIKLPTSTGRVVDVDTLDVRLEELKKHLNFFPSGGAYNWLAPLPDALITDHHGKYLTHDHGIVDQEQAQKLGLLVKGNVLPVEWWQYAFGTLAGKVTKAPLYPRPGEPSQLEVDNRRADESLAVRLSRILG